MNTNAAINKTTHYHGLTRANATAQKLGNFNHAEVVLRGTRAAEVLRKYDIFAKGSKTNGWGEQVEAYDLVKPDGKKYEVQVRPNGQTSCTCPDWKTRRSTHAGLCKHSMAIKAIREGRGE